MKLIRVKNYLLLIDEETEILQMDYYLDDDNYTIAKATLSLDQYEGCVKIIAYRKLNEEAEELDLPLLPNPFEDVYIKELAEQHLQKWRGLNNIHLSNIIHADRCKNDFIAGCKAAFKQFSLEDMKKAIEMARDTYWDIDNRGFSLNTEGDWSYKYSEEEIIQSLSIQQLPKEFIPSYKIDCVKVNCNGECIECNYMEKVLKTIINSEGKQELIGIYKY